MTPEINTSPEINTPPEVITAEDCYALRSTILRPNQPKENWTFDTDHDPNAVHMGIKHGEKLVAVASLLPESHQESDMYPWRLRGMAVIPKLQGQHLGNQLLSALLVHAQQSDGGIWCTARLNVAGFYERNGFKREGDIFTMNNMDHIRMTYTIR